MAELDEDRALTKTPAMTVRIPKCASCGQTHDAVAVQPLATPQQPFTHWFVCPATGDPVPMALLMVDDQTAVAVHSQILQAIVRCLLDRRYMIAFFRVAQGRLTCDAPIYDDFPTGDFGPAIGLLYKLLCEKQDRQTLGIPADSGLSENNAKPMAVATDVRPKVRLFGDQPAGEQYKAH